MLFPFPLNPFLPPVFSPSRSANKETALRNLSCLLVLTADTLFMIVWNLFFYVLVHKCDFNAFGSKKSSWKCLFFTMYCMSNFSVPARLATKFYSFCHLCVHSR